MGEYVNNSLAFAPVLITKAGINKYPLPLIDSILRASVSRLDFNKTGPSQRLPSCPHLGGDKCKTAFNTPFSHFEYLVIPFSLSHSSCVSSTYQ